MCQTILSRTDQRLQIRQFVGQSIPAAFLKFVKRIHHNVGLAEFISGRIHCNRIRLTKRLHCRLSAFGGQKLIYERHVNFFDSVYISRDITDYIKQTPQNRQLDQKLRTASHHGSSVFLIDHLGFFLHLHHRCLVFFVLIFVLNPSKLRIHYNGQF